MILTIRKNDRFKYLQWGFFPTQGFIWSCWLTDSGIDLKLPKETPFDISIEELEKLVTRLNKLKAFI